MKDYAEALGPDRFVIFLFHGVLRRPRAGLRNYTRKHLPVDEFVAVLRSFKAAGTAVSMADVAEAGPDRPLPPRAFAVTFDDGFANNLHVAAPILADLGVPATFYVTTGFLDGAGPSWIDRIERAFEAAPRVVLDGPPPIPRASAANDVEKRILLEAIRVAGKADPAIDPLDLADRIVQAVGGDGPPDPDLDLFLTWDDARALDRSPLFEVGGHGATHRTLSFLDDAALARETDGVLDRLAAELGRPVRHFSYPEGLAHSFDDRVIERLRERGVVCAPTAVAGTNRVGDDPFRLRRIMVT